MGDYLRRKAKARQEERAAQLRGPLCLPRDLLSSILNFQTS